MSAPLEPRWVSVTYTATKAIGAAVVGFLAPGAAYLAGVAGDGVSSSELIVAACFCVGGSALAGGTVYALENKPKERVLEQPAGEEAP